MRRFYHISLTLLICFTIHAQTSPTIFYNDYGLNAQVGDKITIYYAGSINVNLGQLGHTSWDFSNVTSTSSSLVEGMNPSSTPYANIYNGANSVLKVIEGQTNLWFYLIGTPTTKIELMGEAIQDQSGVMHLIYNPPMATNFPINYLDIWNYFGQEITRIGGTDSSTPLTVNTVVDSWGTLKLPDGKVVEALRCLSTESRNNGGSIEITKLIRFITKGGDIIIVYLMPNTATTGLVNVGEFIWYSRKINTYTITISSVNGTVTKVPDLASYNEGSTVQLTANPNAGYTFTEWSGDVTGNTNPISVTMNSNKNITANYSLNTYTLNVTSTNGTVTKNPNQANYNHGTIVQLTATPAAGYTFTGWSGDIIGNSNPISVTMNSNKNVVANFSLVKYTVSTSSNPANGGTTTGSGTYNAGTTVNLTAKENEGFTFKNWTENGIVISTNPNYSFTINSDRTFVANFTQNTYTLTVNSVNGTVTKNPNQSEYNHGSQVQLTAVASAGYTFTGWSGDITSSVNPITITMNSNKNVTANFSEIKYTVTTSSNPVNGGTTSGGGTYNSGSTVTVKAEAKNIPGAKFQFVNWTEGGIEVSKLSNYEFVISANRNLVANFLDVTSVEIEKEIASSFTLSQNYPNPFNPETVISYQLPVASYVTLKVYDVFGGEIKTLVDEYKQPGVYNSTFSTLPASTSARQGGRSSLTSGVYFYQLKAGDYIETKKMILQK